MKYLFSTPLGQATVVAAALLLAPLAGQSQAVVSFGAKLGGNLATNTANILGDAGELSTPDFSISNDRGSILGPQGGLVLNMQWGQWAFQPSLLFSQKGATQNVRLRFGEEDDSQLNLDAELTTRVNYVELPLLAVYNFKPEGGFQIFAGPYIAVGVGGKYTSDVSVKLTDPNNPDDDISFSQKGSKKLKFSDKFEEPDDNSGGGVGPAEAEGFDTFNAIRRFDAGLTGGVGYRTGPLQIQLGYSLGLVNTQPSYPASFEMDDTEGNNRAVQLSATYFFGSK